jgi:hypothetical protein
MPGMRAMLIATLCMFGGVCAFAQSGQVNLSGIYDVYRLDDQRVRVTGEIIRQVGQDFTISGIGQPWSGQGSVTGRHGYYDWRFSDGKSGRTEFSINQDGSLQEHVFGSGLDFMFLARRSSVTLQTPEARPTIPPPARVPHSDSINCTYNGRVYTPFSASLCRNGHMSRCVGNVGEMRSEGGWVVSQLMLCNR